MKKKFILFFCICLYANENWDVGIKEATNLSDIFKNNMDSRIEKPLTSDTQLYTIDNSQSGTANISCGDSKPFIKIGYSGISDISIQIQGDLNLDNSYEKSWIINGVSGICSNGFIKCDTNTWNNCHYYQWNFNNNDIGYNEVQYQNLGGCYCINSSCGSKAEYYKTQIENDIAGAILGVVQNNQNYVVSKVETSNDYAYIWGQSSNCDGNDVPTNITEDNVDILAQEKQNEVISDENSTYYVVTSGTENINKNGQIDDEFKSDISDRTIAVIDSAKLSEDRKKFSYDDGGNSVDGDLQNRDINQTKYCEVTWIENDTTAYSDETTKTDTSSATTKQSEIRECNFENSKWICPKKNNETIKHDCGNINDFGEVTGTLNSVTDATKDFTCSTN